MITKEHIEQAKQDVNQIFDDLLANFKKYATIKGAYWENAKIVVEFETNVDIDIKYWFSDNIHEVEDYVDKIDQTKGIYRIGVNQFDKDWWVQLIGEINSEVVNVGPIKKESELISVNTLFGFYDGYLTPSDVHANLYKTYLGDDQIEERIDAGNKLVLMISGFQKDENGYVSDYEIERRWKAQEPALTDKIRDAIAFVYVMDEPWHKGYDVDFQERAVEAGRRIFGDFKYGFSHMGDHAMNPDKVLARNVDFVGVNNYPFYHPEWADLYNNDLYHVNTKEDFFAFQNQLLDRIRAKVPGKPILLTGQSFYMDKQYRKPPVESPLWYAELIEKNNDVLGVLWYVWESNRKETGVEDMPELYEMQKKAFE